MLKVAFLSFWEGTDITDFKEYMFLKPLRESGIQCMDCNPYVTECHIIFVGVFGKPYLKNIKGNPILISVRTEPLGWFSDNEKLCRYHIGFEQDSDISLYYPLWIFHLKDVLKYRKHNVDINEKTSFCSFIFTNPSCERRNNVFNHINENYKHIDSLGKHLNNTNFILPKRDFIYPRKYKFNICFENTKTDDTYLYITEKILWAYAYNSVPIYWGNSEIETFFDKETFINCNELTNNEIINKIKEIDNNDELFLKMINHNLSDVILNYIQQFKDKFISFINKIITNENITIYDTSI